ncbi:unnamed protein product [Mytilus edulis]|uniref:Uncharacterized protein n=1 Tax=Mytilus edulis TaxID=6550 RepID=A0A8S3TX21_MYTED|nr:unnamed protein product [Mytilus edulis]
MCRVFPQRNEELDCYLANILQIESSYGEKFYEYHKLFAAKAATALRDFKVKFDWGVKDNDILTLLAPHARPEVCRLCYAIDHGTNFCPLSSQSVERSTYPRNRPSSDRVDRRGNDITYYNPHLGMCAKRDSYLRGLGKDTVKKSGIEIDLPFGSSRCIQCRPLNKGFIVTYMHTNVNNVPTAQS